MIKSVKIAVAAVAAGAALTACGPVKTGAAATVGDHRVTVATVESLATEWSKQLPRYPEVSRLVDEQRQRQRAGGDAEPLMPFDPSSPPRSALYHLVDMRVWDRMSHDNGVNVTTGQADQLTGALGGAQAVDPVVMAHGLPTSYRRDFVRRLMEQGLLMKHFGIPYGQQTTPQQDAQVVQAYVKAARALRISVSPRYGSFDAASKGLALQPLRFSNGMVEYQVTAFGPVCPGLSAPESGTGGRTDNEAKCLS